MKDLSNAIAHLTARALELQAQFRRLEPGDGWSRADLVRGFVADVGSLSKLTMAADGIRAIENHQSKLEHEFADCMWSLLVLANEYGVDLVAAFDTMVDDVSKKLSAHSSSAKG